MSFTLFAVLIGGRFAQAAEATTPDPRNDLIDRFVSLESAKSGGHWVRHAYWLGEVTPIETQVDRINASFRIIPGLDGDSRTISFESVDIPGHFLRHLYFRVKLVQWDSTSLFQQDASFIPQFTGSSITTSPVRFESSNFRGRFIRHCAWHLFIDQNDGSIKECDTSNSVFQGDTQFFVRDAKWQDLGPLKYAVCVPQTKASATQLAPSFLDKMQKCTAADAKAVDSLEEIRGNGSVDSKGDCNYSNGVSCHFHTSMEFVMSSGPNKRDGVGEMHCIVPSKDYLNSPIVFGAHLRCKAGTSPDMGTTSCSSALPQVLNRSNCKTEYKCCDNGRLTKPVADQNAAEQGFRPDFRICSDDAIEIDCGLLKGMHGHTANVGALGTKTSGSFPSPPHH